MSWFSWSSLLGALSVASTVLLMPASLARAESAIEPLAIRLGTYDLPPLVIVEEAAGPGGYFGDYLRALETQGTVRFDLSYYRSPEDLADALRGGLVDAAAPLFKREGAEAFADYTASIGTFSIGIFASSRRPQEDASLWELAGRRIAVVRGSYVETSIRNDQPQAQLQVMDSEVAAFAALASNQVDYVILGLVRALHVISNHGLRDIFLTGYAPFSPELAIAVDKEKPHVFRALQAAIPRVSAEQMIDIRKRWMTPLEKPWYQRPHVIPWLVLLNALIAAIIFSIMAMRRALARRGARLHQTQRLLDRTSRSALVGGWQYDVANDDLTWTAQAHLIHGTNPQTFKPSFERCLQLCDDESLPVIRKAFLECCAEGIPFDKELRLKTASGRQIWASLSGEAEMQGGKVTRIFGSLRDIDELKRQRIELERSEKLYRALAEGTSDIVTVHDVRGTCLYASPSVRSLTGYSPSELVWMHPSDLALVEDRQGFDAMLAATREGAAVQEETYRLRCKDGTLRWFEHRASLMEASKLQGEVLIVSRDITERLATQEHFRHLALHDSLTGLHNRLALSQRLSELALAATRDGTRLAVCFLDTDNFKAVNDSFGHTVGDKVVKELAGRVRDVAGAQHLVCRIGGDEFVVLISSPDVAGTADALSEALMKALSAPIELAEGSVTVTASVGIAQFPDDADSGEELLTAASTAMYAAKRDGKNTCRRYTAEMGRASAAKARALQDVRGAYERNELELFFQPKISLEDGRVSGAEALLRWRTPHGYRGPVELIAAAEESGFIRTLGRWVLEAAARQVIAWAAQGVDCPIAVNVSVRQLHDGEFVGHLTDLINNTPQLAERLELEITETAIATDADTVLQLLTEIRRLGVKVHIDDFGTGYSSLSYLGRLPVNTLKIDLSLVQATTTARDAREIVRAIIALAASLGLETVAEGVETPAHAEFLKQCGCTHAQGYLFAKPMPPKEFASFYLSHQDSQVEMQA
jgi:diguanylate cyclase (GGDEF)-like protein/PAS domain S-box-containing protein